MHFGRELAVLALGLGLASSTLFCGGAQFEVASGDDDGGASGSSSGSSGGSSGSSGSGSSGGHHDGGDGSGGSSGSGGGSGSDSGGSSGGGDDASDLDAIATEAGGFDANAPFSCATQPTTTLKFCDDFENETATFSMWDADPATGTGASNTLDGAHFASPTHGYTAAVGINTGACFAELQKSSLTIGSATIDYAFSMNIQTLDSGTSTTIARLAIDKTNPRELYIDLVLDKSGALHLVQNAPTSDGGTATDDQVAHGAFTPLTWHRIRLTLARAPSSGSPKVTLTFDESTAFTTAMIPSTPTSTQVEVDLGIVFSAPATLGGSKISFDDVVVRGL